MQSNVEALSVLRALFGLGVLFAAFFLWFGALNVAALTGFEVESGSFLSLSGGDPPRIVGLLAMIPMLAATAMAMSGGPREPLLAGVCLFAVHKEPLALARLGEAGAFSWPPVIAGVAFAYVAGVAILLHFLFQVAVDIRRNPR